MLSFRWCQTIQMVSISNPHQRQPKSFEILTHELDKQSKILALIGLELCNGVSEIAAKIQYRGKGTMEGTIK